MVIYYISDLIMLVGFCLIMARNENFLFRHIGKFYHLGFIISIMRCVYDVFRIIKTF